MKKNLALMLMLSIFIFNPSVNYSMQKKLQNPINSLLDVELDFDKINKLIDFQELGNFLIKIITEDDPTITVLDIVRLIKNEDFYNKLKPFENQIITGLADFIPLPNFSKYDKIAFLENNIELVKNLLKCSLNFALNQEINSKHKENISKALINDKLSITLSSKDFKNIVLGIGSMTTIWLLGHAFFHDYMELLEPQQMLSATLYILIICGTTYHIINKVLNIPDSSTDLIFELFPSIANWITTKTEFGQQLTDQLKSLFTKK